MRVKRVTLLNFRNYAEASLELCPGRNILIGENAQGKTNLLEAIELASSGKSQRAQKDADLIGRGADHMRLEVIFEARAAEESISIYLGHAGPDKRRALEKQVKINGLTQSQMKGLKGRLVVVSFKSQDLYLLRGGPKYRREWIDTIAETLRPAYRELSSRYQKVVIQRNRLLKMLFEKGRVTVTDQDQLKVWDAQLAKCGAGIIKQRMELLAELLPKAERFQQHISGHREVLTAQYHFAERESGNEENSPAAEQLSLPLAEASSSSEAALGAALLRVLVAKRREEIARKQTLVGPHRDDISFYLNGLSAVEFASQGQQRSLVLSLKLAELERITEVLSEPPVLLLDDVLAELDLIRQGLLMSLVGENMQTLITTTHVDGFQPEWLEGALFIKVHAGTVQAAGKTAPFASAPS